MKNKKKYLFIIIILLFCSIIIYLLNENHSLKESSNNYENNKVIKNKNMLSMMLETEANSGNYEMTSRSEWPTDGYIFNTELSKCENGSKLSWDDINKRVVMSGNVSDKCYVYFDIKPQVLLADYIKSLYTGTQGANNIYYHDGSLENGINDNSYRFSGASSEVNNYVCFGSNEITCPKDNLYRIIGVFDGRVKLIKADFATSKLLGTDGDYNKVYGALDWDNSNYKENDVANIIAYNWNKTGENTWSMSNLNKINLNQNFITNIGVEWADKIDETIWKVGGNTHENLGAVPAKIAYQNEIVNPSTNSQDNKTEYSAKIGLMYVSDYMFAAQQDKWTLVGYNPSDVSKDYREAISVNWMNVGLYEWTISRYDNSSNHTFRVYGNGIVGGSSVDSIAWAVRPVFYLKSSVTYVEGNGTKDSPIRIN